MSVLVIGSFMMDCVSYTKRAPNAGETIIGKDYKTFPGGKGANQAVAAKRLGSHVYMAGMLGTDAFAELFKDTFNHEQIDITHVKTCDTHTGIGSITLEDNGENRIVVIPGANLEYTVNDFESLNNLIPKMRVVVAQLEMRIDVIEMIASKCEEHNIPLILNPAPSQPLSDKLLSKVTYLTPNETELASLVGKQELSLKEQKITAAKQLLKKGVKHVIVTLGSDGAILVTPQEVKHFKGYNVHVIDTVAAGDSFNGALAYGIDQGLPLYDTITLANAVGALTVQKEGAIPSLPTKDDVNQFLTKSNRPLLL